MASEPAYLRNLKQYTRTQIETPEDSAKVMEDLRNESDRGAIILIATQLEDCIELALLNKMAALQEDKEAKSAVFGAEGTVATYADKILIAYALGIIDKKGRNDITLVRQIRNACAHGRKPLLLTMPVLADAVKAAIGPALAEQVERMDNKPFRLRAAFIMHCAALSHYVLTGERQPALTGESYPKA